MAYTTINKSGDYFNTKLWTGNDSAQSITGVGFQPDWTWIKCRSHGGNASFEHILTDAVRGVNKTLFSNSNSSEVTNNSVGYLSAFGSDGFTVTGQDATSGNGRTYVGWNWKANGTGSANTDGSITSTVSVNTTAGFSIVKWTGSNANATIGHGLGEVPKTIIVKNLATATSWMVYHVTQGATKFLRLNETNAVATGSTPFNDTTPTSSVFSVGANGDTNGSSQEMIAYCFAQKTGYSKFSSYTGNGNADGTFVYTGFKPAFVMIKRTDSTSEWNIYDVKRNPHNLTNLELEANTSDAEANVSEREIDILSNGFKFRGTSGFTNQSGGSYIYMCFASAPLVGTNNVPANAR